MQRVCHLIMSAHVFTYGLSRGSASNLAKMKRTKGNFGSEPCKMLPHNKYLSKN